MARDLDALQGTCTAIFEALGRQWSWDRGLDTALLTFKTEERDEVMPVLEKNLVHTWTSDTVDGAPDLIRDLVGGLGGLRPGQWIMHSDAGAAAVLVGVFWPWSGGSPISLRLGVLTGDSDRDEANGLLQGWMKVSS